MDASMAGYLSVLPFVLFIISWLIPKIPLQGKIILNYTFVFTFLTAVITAIDFNIYTEWGTKINARAIDFLFESPSEAMASAASSPLYSSLFIVFALSMFGFYLSNKIIFKQDLDKSYFLIKFPIALLILGLTFLAIRGGWGIAPMNPSKVYFSEKPILNHAAINTNWLLLSNYIKKADKKNPYQYLEQTQRDAILKELYPKTNATNTLLILSVKKPNVVLIILEGFTADVIKELGGEEQTTPGFSALAKEGLLFSNIYSSGDRTDKGLIAILSGFPSQAIRSIIKENDKQEKLPSLIKSFGQAGYRTSFFYGGDTEFSNFKSYLISSQVQQLTDASDFNSEDLTSKWGAYDEVTFKKQLQFLNQESQPFFSTLLTLSNHEPFELPKESAFGKQSVENKFRSTSHYTAACLLNFVEEAKKESWYHHTLFVVVADHGHRLPKNIYESHMTERYHIPLLLFGGALKTQYKGKVVDKIGNQTDIAATLLGQLNLQTQAFKYSNNLLNTATKGFSFYNWDNGFGIVEDHQAISYDPISQTIIYQKPKTISPEKQEELLLKAKAMMQSVYQDYLDY
jgi:phosphoglycerol transferase MdoB-like AlkP superfamily enzyme